MRREKVAGKLTAYDRMSRWYDLFGGFEARPRLEGLRMLKPAKGEAILEIGAGTGQALVELAAAVGAAGATCGLDRSSGMLAVCRRRLARAALAERVSLTCADGIWLPYPDGCFDGVFMSFTLESFSATDIPRVLAECRRVLRAGGRLCVVAMVKQEPPNTITRLYEWCHAKLPQIVDCRPIAVQDTLRSAGFRIEEATTCSLYGLSIEAVASGVN